MKHSKTTYLPIFFIFLLLHSCSSKQEEPEVNKPNIILIMSDDHGWGDAGFNGSTDVKTPNMDALAAKGVVFDRFYSASAVCSPTRASLMTGRNPLRLNIPYANQGHLNDEEITIAELVRAAGYTTGHFGKWHLGTLTQDILDAKRGGKEKYLEDYSIPSSNGYDSYFCTESKVPTFDPMVYPTSFAQGESKRFGWRAVENQDSTKSYGTAYWVDKVNRETKNLEGDDSKIILDRVIPFIESARRQNKPFFTTIWFHTPHLPVVSDSTHRALYPSMSLEKQIYYGAITAMDEQIGRLWYALEKEGIAENTILFYCSDNGPEVRTPGSAGDFRERKRSLYEGGVRVPAFAIWGDQFLIGKRIDYPSVTSDYLPTLLAILDLDYPDARPLDGQNILEVLTGNKPERRKPIGFICRPQISWVDEQYKLIGDKIKGDYEYELYDLVNDKTEKSNIIADYPEIAEQMKKELTVWRESVENSSKGNDYDAK